MTGRNLLIVASLAVGIVVSSGPTLWSRAAAAAVDPHAYFDALVTRADFWKGYSLRPQVGDPITGVHYEHQLKHPQAGGYANCGSCPLWVTYDPSMDTDPDRQDAAKMVIPAWASRTALAAPMLASTPGAIETITFNNVVSVGSSQGLRIGTEIVRIDGSQPQSASMRVKRGQYGTTASAHSAGAVVEASTNSLPNQVRVPIGTTDGHVYLFTWDIYMTSSYLSSGLTNNKAFQLSDDRNSLWLQPGIRYDGSSVKPPGWNPATDLGVADFRANHVLGPGTTSIDPIRPWVGRFIIKPNTWTRYWVQIDQRANAEDPMDAWVADENQAAVQLYAGIPTQVKNGKIAKFWIEFNTSTDNYVRGDSRDLVSYVRNFVALKNPSGVPGLLERPVGTSPAPWAPPPPLGLRILRP